MRLIKFHNIALLIPVIALNVGNASWALTYQRIIFSDHPQISPYFVQEARVPLPKSSALRLVCSDAWSTQTEADVIR